jgi:hypothetical protein
VTWLDFKCKVKEVTSRLTSDAVPITFLYGETEICPTDITIRCDITGDKITLIIDLKEGDNK